MTSSKKTPTKTTKTSVSTPKKTITKTTPASTKIVEVAENPKRKGCKAEARFALYKKGSTIESFLKAGGTRADVRYDAKHGHIKLAS